MKTEFPPSEDNFVKSHVVEAAKSLALYVHPDEAVRRTANEFGLNQKQTEKLRWLLQKSL